MSIESELVTLQKITQLGYCFSVPIYQRLYVWGADQVRTLLEDLLSAFTSAKNDIFYLGGALVMSQRAADGESSLELIDGQQRFTTLWMLSLVWRESLEQFLHDANNHSKPRVTFSIRPEVNAFFADRLAGKDVKLGSAPKIEDALAQIQSFRDMHKNNISFEDFTLYIFEKVQMVITSVSSGTDINKLFELINNRGVQLQHHEILKARMLSFIVSPGVRQRFSYLWDACSHMEGFVERNIRDITDLDTLQLFDNKTSHTNAELLASGGAVLEALRLQREGRVSRVESLQLEDLLAGYHTREVDDEVDDDGQLESLERVRSIVSFSMLLQHTLRIWLFNNKRSDVTRILDKELLGNFQCNFFTGMVGELQVKSFLQLLWKVRYCFDKYVIKWVFVDTEERHLINSMSIEKSGKYKQLRRQIPEGNDGLSLLQSMLYHSQEITTHYWLTPFLAYIVDNPDTKDAYYAYLRHLDSNLLCGLAADNLCQRSRSFLVDPWRKVTFDTSLLNEPLGVEFPHYWFYKLEFVLWYFRERMEGKSIKENQIWSNFRITAKNSIEHVAPQTAQAVDIYRFPDKDSLNCFGNLALVSRSVNSEYGNKPFNEKRQHFVSRNRERIDSLKSALIYRSSAWSLERASEHQRQMIELLEEYLDETPEEET